MRPRTCRQGAHPRSAEIGKRVATFFNDWSSIWRVIVAGTLAYTALVVLLRVSGKRTLSKMNAFDLVVTVAIGSTFATILLSKDVALSEGVTALVLLVALQYVIAWLSVRSDRVRQIVKSEPALLYYQGAFLRDAMRRERVTENEVLAAIRSQGLLRGEDVEAVGLETDGSVTVIPAPTGGAREEGSKTTGQERGTSDAGSVRSTLQGVSGAPQRG